MDIAKSLSEILSGGQRRLDGYLSRELILIGKNDYRSHIRGFSEDLSAGKAGVIVTEDSFVQEKLGELPRSVILYNTSAGERCRGRMAGYRTPQVAVRLYPTNFIEADALVEKPWRRRPLPPIPKSESSDGSLILSEELSQRWQPGDVVSVVRPELLPAINASLVIGVPADA